MELKGKTVAFFNALPHHGRFLFPIAEALQREGAEVFFFTSLVDYPFEKDIQKSGFRYKFLIQYADDETRRKIRSSLKELMDQWMKINYTWHGFRHWSLFQQHRSLTRNVEDYFCIEEMIKKEKPDMIVTLHEMNPWGKQIGHLAHKNGIAFITLQEGDYYNSLINLTTHNEYSLVNLLWGLETRDRLLTHKCSPYKQVIVGNTHIDESIKKCTPHSVVKETKKELAIPPMKKVVTLITNLFWGAVMDKSIWHNLLIGLKRPDIFCIFKWHPQVAYHTFEAAKKAIQETLPDALFLFNYDPYKVLAVSHYCVVMGKSTLGVEALAFGKPLFDLYSNIDAEVYYANLKVAQSVSPAGNWEALFTTMRDGVPKEIHNQAEDYVRFVFYRLDGKSIERAVHVMSSVLGWMGKGQRHEHLSFTFDRPMAPSRISYIIPSGNDPIALLATLTSLSQYVKHEDCQYIVVLNDEAMKELIPAVSSDITFVEEKSERLARLYNAGARVSTGEYLIFVKPGIIYYRDEGLVEAIKEGGIASIPFMNPNLSANCLGLGCDFNFSPYTIQDTKKERQFLSNLLLATRRCDFELLRGFDEEVSFFAIDMCLCAREYGIAQKYLPDCLGFVFKPTFSAVLTLEYHTMEWQPLLQFFARWYSKLPKDEDFLSHAAAFLQSSSPLAQAGRPAQHIGGK